MILVKNSKCLSSLLFGIRYTSFLSSDDVVFPKGGFLDHINVILLQSKNLHFSKGVNQWFWLNIPNFFQASFFCKRELRFSSDDGIFSKWVFLDGKNVISLWSKNWHLSKGVNRWFWSKIPDIFQAYFSVKESSVFSFDDVVLSKGSFLDNKIANVRG